MVRAGLTLLLVSLVVPAVGLVQPEAGWASAGMIIAELACGAVLGWLARCVMLALPMAGQVISFMTGLSSVIASDPLLGQSSGFMRLFSIAAAVIVLKSGLWALPVAALSNSYSLVTVGHFLPIADSCEAAISVVADAFGLALRLAAPLVIVSVLWQFGLGIIARLIPQLQVYFAALPGQILGGIALLGLLSTGLVQAWVEAARAGFGHLPGLL